MQVIYTKYLNSSAEKQRNSRNIYKKLNSNFNPVKLKEFQTRIWLFEPGHTGHQGIDSNRKNLACMHSRRNIYEKDRVGEQRQCE
jgi:hypothetical protein